MARDRAAIMTADHIADVHRVHDPHVTRDSDVVAAGKNEVKIDSVRWRAKPSRAAFWEAEAVYSPVGLVVEIAEEADMAAASTQSRNSAFDGSSEQVAIFFILNSFCSVSTLAGVHVNVDEGNAANLQIAVPTKVDKVGVPRPFVPRKYRELRLEHTISWYEADRK
jgi:hypothetical protein